MHLTQKEQIMIELCSTRESVNRSCRGCIYEGTEECYRLLQKLLLHTKVDRQMLREYQKEGYYYGINQKGRC